jgi:hypothetical protein
MGVSKWGAAKNLSGKGLGTTVRGEYEYSEDRQAPGLQGLEKSTGLKTRHYKKKRPDW